MCLTCGCLDAHKLMADNMTYEDLKRITDGNGKTVDQTLDLIQQTADLDRAHHQPEYSQTNSNE